MTIPHHQSGCSAACHVTSRSRRASSWALRCKAACAASGEQEGGRSSSAPSAIRRVARGTWRSGCGTRASSCTRARRITTGQWVGCGLRTCFHKGAAAGGGREEIVAALGEWIAIEGDAGKPPRWQRMARAVRTGGPGIRTRSARLRHRLRHRPRPVRRLKLAGPESDSIEGTGFSVSEVVQNGSLLTVKVAEFADIADPYLWMLRQPPTFLIEALRDGVAGMGEAPAGQRPAAGVIGGESSPAPVAPAFTLRRVTRTGPVWVKASSWCGGHPAQARRLS